MSGAYVNQRGTAIINYPRGILVVRQGKAPYLLPGGSVKKQESRIMATIRELKEETGLTPYEIKYLFTYQNSKVFLCKSEGQPKPRSEINSIEYYTKESNIKLSYHTKKIIDMYLNKDTNITCSKQKCQSAGEDHCPGDKTALYGYGTSSNGERTDGFGILGCAKLQRDNNYWCPYYKKTKSILYNKPNIHYINNHGHGGYVEFRDEQC